MIEIKNLQKNFGKKQALCGMNLKLEHGIIGLLGPNGAGKTTFLRTLLGLYQKDGGNILLYGTNEEHGIASVCGYLPQSFGGFGSMRVQEFLEYMAALKRINRPEAEIAEALQLVNLSDRARDRISILSGGMVRRLGIAQAILGKPEVMVFDEPTTGLDPEERIRFRNLILQLPKDRIVLISTHIVDDVAMICDRVAVMRKGKCIISTEPEKLTELADGHVFSIPREQPIPEGAILSSSSIYSKGNRVVSPKHILEGCTEAPTLEDGYLFVLHGMGDQQ